MKFGLVAIVAIVALHNSKIVVADESASETAPYCLNSFDYSCWSKGKPGCCLDTVSNNCPTEAPACVPGASYCTWAPNYDCFDSGFPACCATDAASCPAPDAYPECTITTTGSSYCQNAPDKTCFVSGWPTCCSNTPPDCPADPPLCEEDGVNHCNTMTNNGCYETGWPACCVGQDTSACLVAGDLSCDNDAGSSACKNGADYSCYSDNGGFPLCCSSFDGSCDEGDLICTNVLYATSGGGALGATENGTATTEAAADGSTGNATEAASAEGATGDSASSYISVRAALPAMVLAAVWGML